MAKKPAKPPRKRLRPPTKPAGKGKMPIAVLTATATANIPARIEVQITDPKYAVEILADDIDNERVWFEAPADDQGWMKLYYSADGPTGDPFPIGRIKIHFDLSDLDDNFGDFSELTWEKPGGAA